MNIQGATAPGFSTGAAMEIMEDRPSKQLPPGFGVGGTALSYEERLSGNQAPALHALIDLSGVPGTGGTL